MAALRGWDGKKSLFVRHQAAARAGVRLEADALLRVVVTREREVLDLGAMMLRMVERDFGRLYRGEHFHRRIEDRRELGQDSLQVHRSLAAGDLAEPRPHVADSVRLDLAHQTVVRLGEGHGYGLH